ncbi:MAG: hypothetical protein ACE5F1_12815 [Planctomycetota bacterium]
MRDPCRLLVPMFVLATLGFVDSAKAQGRGGGRGPSEAILSRMGNYFVNVTLPVEQDGQSTRERLAASPHVTKARDKRQLCLLYLYDRNADPKKHDRFQQVLFANQGVGVALRLFRCGKLDLGLDDGALAAYGKKAPLFIAFDAKGKRTGEVSMRGYKTSSGPLLKLLARAARGHSKLSLPAFSKKYRSFLTQLQVLEGRQRTLTQKRARLADMPGSRGESKRAKLTKEEDRLAESEKALFAAEKKLLEQARVPARDPNAQRLGGRSGRGFGR